MKFIEEKLDHQNVFFNLGRMTVGNGNFLNGQVESFNLNSEEIELISQILDGKEKISVIEKYVATPHFLSTLVRRADLEDKRAEIVQKLNAMPDLGKRAYDAIMDSGEWNFLVENGVKLHLPNLTEGENSPEIAKYKLCDRNAETGKPQIPQCDVGES